MVFSCFPDVSTDKTGNSEYIVSFGIVVMVIIVIFLFFLISKFSAGTEGRILRYLDIAVGEGDFLREN